MLDWVQEPVGVGETPPAVWYLRVWLWEDAGWSLVYQDELTLYSGMGPVCSQWGSEEVGACFGAPPYVAEQWWKWANGAWAYVSMRKNW